MGTRGSVKRDPSGAYPNRAAALHALDTSGVERVSCDQSHVSALSLIRSAKTLRQARRRVEGLGRSWGPRDGVDLIAIELDPTPERHGNDRLICGRIAIGVLDQRGGRGCRCAAPELKPVGALNLVVVEVGEGVVHCH